MTTVASTTTDVIAAITVAYDLLVGALFTPVLGAILWRRGTAAGALASIAVGGIAVLVLLFLRGIDSDAPIYGGLGLSVATYIMVSAASKSGIAVPTTRTSS